MSRNAARARTELKGPAGRIAAPASRGPSQRQLRVAEEIRHVLADLFTRVEFRDPELAGVHITVIEVRISPDLRQATAFVARLGRSDVAALLPALARAAPYLRSEFGRSVRLRGVPALHFQPDTALDYAMEIDALLRRPEVAKDLRRDGWTGTRTADGLSSGRPQEGQMADDTPKQQAHEQALDLVEEALGKLEEKPKEAEHLLDKARSIDPSAAKEVLSDLDEDAGSDHTSTAG